MAGAGQQRPALNLMPRDQFAALSLHAKNDYLQGLAKSFAASTSREYQPLDRDALSRLRRYYSRRVFADLKLDNAPDSALNDALRSLGEAIRASDLNLDVAAALLDSLPAKRTLRTPPADDAQMMFFVPAVYDAPVKDDVNLMDIAPFSLSKSPRTGVIKYELKDCLVTVEGGAESGLATVFDYDIFLNMVSYLAEEMRRYRIEEAKGVRPSLPHKIYRPSTAHILKFCRRTPGGRTYLDLEAALDRCAKTSVKIVNLAGGKRRQVDSRPLIGGYRIVSKTSTGYIDEVEISIPDWVYTSIVRSDKALPILTLHRDYFLISSGLGRFIYRLARKTAKQGSAHYTAGDLHHRSGSRQELRFFTRDLKQFVSTTKLFPLPEYDLELSTGRDGPVLHIRHRKEMPQTGEVVAIEHMVNGSPAEG